MTTKAFTLSHYKHYAVLSEENEAGLHHTTVKNYTFRIIGGGVKNTSFSASSCNNKL